MQSLGMMITNAATDRLNQQCLSYLAVLIYQHNTGIICHLYVIYIYNTLYQVLFFSNRGRFKFLGLINKTLVQATVQKPKKIKLISLVINNPILPFGNMNQLS